MESSSQTGRDPQARGMAGQPQPEAAADPPSASPRVLLAVRSASRWACDREGDQGQTEPVRLQESARDSYP